MFKTNFLVRSLVVICLLGCKSEEIKTTKVTTLVKTTQSWNGTDLPKYPQESPEITILKITIPPKTQLPLHKHPVINAGVLVKGELTVIAEKGGDTLHLQAGETIVELVDKWHFGRNDGVEPAEIIVFYAGTKGNPITILKNSKSH